MAYQISPRFGSSAFIPPPDVFQEGRNGAVQRPGLDTPRDFRPRRSQVLTSDPVAMHLLVETAMGDSQNFDVLSVEEVETLKQEQRGLDVRLNTVRRKLESETKIRDAARSLTRLTSKKDKGHRRGLSSRGSNASKDTSARSEEELNASNRKVDDLTRELLEIESRMRLIDMQLLMHTAGVLQLTHNGPTKRNQSSQLSNAGGQRPDSPASIYTYDTGNGRVKGEGEFDERSLYRSPENLDSLMNALQNGTHLHSESVERQNEALSSTAKRLEDLNIRMRELIVEANPERNRDYSRAPTTNKGTIDAFAVEQQLDFLDQGLRDISAEHSNVRSTSKHSLNAVEGRLEGINNQLYAMLTRSDENTLPPPAISGGGSQEQLNYMEDSFYNLEQVQFSMTQQLEDLQSQTDSMTRQLDEMRTLASKSEGVERYETTLMGLWSIILAGEEEARQRKRERRALLAQDPAPDEELSPDEDFDPNEQFSLPAFSAKVQWLYSRASNLKEKQSILLRQIKQQRDLNSRSDAQKEEQFGQLKEQVLSARSEKASMEKELERAMGQLKQFDEAKSESDNKALQNAQSQIQSLQSQVQEAQNEARIEAATIQAELSQSSTKIEEITAALRAATAEKEAAEARSMETSKTLTAKEEELGELESEVARLITEVTLAKAELDGAYGTRAERAAENAAPIKKELEELSTKNTSLLTEVEALRKAADAASQSEAEARDSERNLKQELSAMAAEYEALTKDSIQNEKDRDTLEASIDKLRDEKESLEMELSDEKVKWLGVRSPSVPNGAAPGNAEATSIRMLREDFRKMMRDRTAEGLRALRVRHSLR
jgi:chromosome segregation ATPase